MRATRFVSLLLLLVAVHGAKRRLSVEGLEEGKAKRVKRDDSNSTKWRIKIRHAAPIKHSYPRAEQDLSEWGGSARFDEIKTAPPSPTNFSAFPSLSENPPKASLPETYDPYRTLTLRTMKREQFGEQFLESGKELGEGGYGTVTKAVDRRASMTVAIKSFKPNANPLDRQREIIMGRGVHHPNILCCLEGICVE